MDVSAQNTPSAPPTPDVLLCWMPDEGEPVSVLGYPSPQALGVVESIERDEGGAATTYWIWMLDGCRISLDAQTARQQLTRL